MGHRTGIGQSEGNVSLHEFFRDIQLYLCMDLLKLFSRAMESDEEEDDTAASSIPSQELNAAIRDLSARLENLKTCYDLISKHGLALQRALTDLENGDDVPSKTKVVSERATLFRISSNAMMNVSTEMLLHWME